MLHNFKNFLAVKESFQLDATKSVVSILRDMEEFFNSKGVEVQRVESNTGRYLELPKGLHVEVGSFSGSMGVEGNLVDFLLLNEDEIVCDWTDDLEEVLKKYLAFEPIVTESRMIAVKSRQPIEGNNNRYTKNMEQLFHEIDERFNQFGIEVVKHDNGYIDLVCGLVVEILVNFQGKHNNGKMADSKYTTFRLYPVGQNEYVRFQNYMTWTQDLDELIQKIRTYKPWTGIKESHTVQHTFGSDSIKQRKGRLHVIREIEEYLNEKGVEIVNDDKALHLDHIKLANGMSLEFLFNPTLVQSSLNFDPKSMTFRLTTVEDRYTLFSNGKNCTQDLEDVVKQIRANKSL